MLLTRTTSHPTRRAPAALVALLAAALLAASCSTGGGKVEASKRSGERGGGGRPAASEVEWGACTSRIASLAGLQCGTLSVPVDHDEPDGDRIDLALARVGSSGPADQRLGSLVINPGGPGQSGIEYLANAASTLPAALRARFDLVSFDPRGVAESAPVRCIDDETKDAQLEGDLSPDTEAELEEALAEHEELREGCERRAGDLMPHMSTADVAADLDLIREALGDEQLTYLGFSYGTAIGAVYATSFPDGVRALVLDGSVSPGATREEELLAQGRGFEGTLAKFVERCNADPQCALAPDAAGAIAAARASLESQPVTVATPSGDRTLGVDLFDLGLATALYDTTLWGMTANAIASLRDGGAGVIFSLVDRQIGRQPDGSYDNSTDSRTIVNCADEPERPERDEAIESAHRIIEQLPTFGDAIGWGALGCLDWPLPDEPLPELDGAGAAPILVVGTVGDPATPYVWAEQMAEALESARLLTYEGEGHTALTRGGPCIEEAVVAYLVDLTLPPEGTRCPSQPGSVSFAGLRDEVVSQFVDSGLPESVATCVVDGMVEELGEGEFDRLMLSQDVDRLSELVTRQTVRCAAGG